MTNMLYNAEFTIIEDPLRPSVGTNLCSVCFRHRQYEGKGIGCCSYEPEFCLFDLVFLYLKYPDIYDVIRQKGRIIKGFNGIMAEMKTGISQCPFVGSSGCTLPRDALTPLCRLFICREAAVFAPARFEERFDAYFTGIEYGLNQKLNELLLERISEKSEKSGERISGKPSGESGLTWVSLHDYIADFARIISREIASIDRTNYPTESYRCVVDLAEFGRVTPAPLP